MDIQIPIMGRVYYEDNLVRHEKVSYVEYIQNPKELDFSIPTLIVGWNYLKKQNIEANILEKKINDNLYWEFAFNEHKTNHISGLNNFAEDVPSVYFNNNFEYQNIDPVFNKIKSFYELDIYFKLIDKAYVYDNEILYILKNNKVYSFNLLMFRFLKIDIDLKISGINSNLIYFDNGNIFTDLCKRFNFMYDFKRFVVVLL